MIITRRRQQSRGEVNVTVCLAVRSIQKTGSLGISTPKLRSCSGFHYSADLLASVSQMIDQIRQLFNRASELNILRLTLVIDGVQRHDIAWNVVLLQMPGF